MGYAVSLVKFDDGFFEGGDGRYLNFGEDPGGNAVSRRSKV